jgi:hypothetical protein
MKLILATVIFLLSFLAPQSLSAMSERCVQKVESDCYYVVEEKYKGLEEFEFFWTGDVKGNRHFSIKGKAYIHGVFTDLTGVLENNRLSFVTSISQGFTYKFVGRFIPEGKAVKDGRIHIQGKLIKLKESRMVLSRKVEFYVGSGYNT